MNDTNRRFQFCTFVTHPLVAEFYSQVVPTLMHRRAARSNDTSTKVSVTPKIMLYDDPYTDYCITPMQLETLPSLDDTTREHPMAFSHVSRALVRSERYKNDYEHVLPDVRSFASSGLGRATHMIRGDAGVRFIIAPEEIPIEDFEAFGDLCDENNHIVPATDIYNLGLGEVACNPLAEQARTHASVSELFATGLYVLVVNRPAQVENLSNYKVNTTVRLTAYMYTDTTKKFFLRQYFLPKNPSDWTAIPEGTEWTKEDVPNERIGSIFGTNNSLLYYRDNDALLGCLHSEGTIQAHDMTQDGDKIVGTFMRRFMARYDMRTKVMCKYGLIVVAPFVLLNTFKTPQEASTFIDLVSVNPDAVCAFRDRITPLEYVFWRGFKDLVEEHNLTETRCFMYTASAPRNVTYGSWFTEDNALNYSRFVSAPITHCYNVWNAHAMRTHNQSATSTSLFVDFDEVDARQLARTSMQGSVLPFASISYYTTQRDTDMYKKLKEVTSKQKIRFDVFLYQDALLDRVENSDGITSKIRKHPAYILPFAFDESNEDTKVALAKCKVPTISLVDTIAYLAEDTYTTPDHTSSDPEPTQISVIVERNPKNWRDTVHAKHMELLTHMDEVRPGVIRFVEHVTDPDAEPPEMEDGDEERALLHTVFRDWDACVARVEEGHPTL